MIERIKPAALDSDFISKTYRSLANGERLLDVILGLTEFEFICHEYVFSEINRYDPEMFSYLAENVSNGRIIKYNDEMLLNRLSGAYLSLGCSMFIDFLEAGCNYFSASLFKDVYGDLAVKTRKHGITDADFLIHLSECDKSVVNDFNLGEIKTSLMLQTLFVTGSEKVMFFCSDDRKACLSMNVMNNIECIGSLSSFWVIKQIAKMEKEMAGKFFSAWMQLHRNTSGQVDFKVYDYNGNVIKQNGFDIFDGIYGNEFGLVKDGFLKKRRK